MAVRRSLVFGPPRVASLDPLFPLQPLKTNSCSGIFQNRTPFRPAVANYKSPTTEVKQPWMGAWRSCQDVRLCSTRNENKVPFCSIFGCCSKLACPASSSRNTSGWRPKQYTSGTARDHERLDRGRAPGYRRRGDHALLALGRSTAYRPVGDPKRGRSRFACRAFAQSDSAQGAADDVRAITRAGGPVGHRRATPGYGGAIRDSRPGHGTVRETLFL